MWFVYAMTFLLFTNLRCYKSYRWNQNILLCDCRSSSAQAASSEFNWQDSGLCFSDTNMDHRKWIHKPILARVARSHKGRSSAQVGELWNWSKHFSSESLNRLGSNFSNVNKIYQFQKANLQNLINVYKRHLKG